MVDALGRHIIEIEASDVDALVETLKPRLGAALEMAIRSCSVMRTKTSARSRAAGGVDRTSEGAAHSAPEPERRVPLGQLRGKCPDDCPTDLRRTRARGGEDVSPAHAPAVGNGASTDLAVRDRSRLRRRAGARQRTRLPAVPGTRRARHDGAVRRHAGGADHRVRQGIRRDAHADRRAVRALLDHPREDPVGRAGRNSPGAAAARRPGGPRLPEPQDELRAARPRHSDDGAVVCRASAF